MPRFSAGRRRDDALVAELTAPIYTIPSTGVLSVAHGCPQSAKKFVTRVGRAVLTEPRGRWELKYSCYVQEGGSYGMGVRVSNTGQKLTGAGVGEADYKTEEACINANAGTNDTFWCVTRNWLDKGQRRPVRAFVTD